MPEVGTTAPALALENQEGTLVDLRSLKGKWVVVYFYPRDSTPGCTTEACDFRDNFERLSSKGAVVLGISKDSAKSHLKFREKQNLPFDLLVDAQGKVCEDWGVWRMKKFMGREGLGIVRSTFLVDPSGKIARIWSPVSVKGHVAEILGSF